MIIIKSQNGTELFKTESVVIKGYEIQATDGVHERKRYWTIGEYDSEERTKEVFELIEKHIREQYFFEKTAIPSALNTLAFMLTHSEKNVTAKNDSAYLEKINEIQTISFNDRAIFVMPKK